MTIEDIARLCEQGAIRWTAHILKRLFVRAISMDEVIAALTSGEIVENYPNDYPYPSCLVLGFAGAGKPLHIVCGYDGTELWLITAYIPNPAEWSGDFRIRQEQTT